MSHRILPGLLLALVLAPAASAQNLQYEVAGLREDIRGLVQRVGELNLRVEQLERENAELRKRTTSQDFATITQLNEAVADLNRTISAAAASSKSETLQQVAAQMERLAKQTNAAIDSLAKGMATRPAVNNIFTDDYPKEGLSYTIQKGDTLSSIATKHGAKVQDIINANKITDPRSIQVGQTLFIPTSAK